MFHLDAGHQANSSRPTHADRIRRVNHAEGRVTERDGIGVGRGRRGVPGLRR
jgi:hypothetical protein